MYADTFPKSFPWMMPSYSTAFLRSRLDFQAIHHSAKLHPLKGAMTSLKRLESCIVDRWKTYGCRTSHFRRGLVLWNNCSVIGTPADSRHYLEIPPRELQSGRKGMVFGSKSLSGHHP